MKKLVLVLGLYLSITSTYMYPQSYSLSDIFPISVGKSWNYKFRTLDAAISIHYSIKDTGFSKYTVMTSENFNDSILWNIKAYRNFTRYTYQGNPDPISTQTIIDSFYFHIAEKLNDKHELLLNIFDPFIVFPFYRSAPDSERFYRYIQTDTLGNATLNLTPYQGWPEYYVSYSLQKDVGIIHTDGLQWSGTSYIKTDYYLFYPSTSIESIENSPNNFLLNQNYPNPFNPSTKIIWQTPVSGWQTLKVYNVLGKEIATLVDDYKPAGSYKIEFNPNDLPSGVYFYQLEAGDLSTGSGQVYVETKKMILLK